MKKREQDALEAFELYKGASYADALKAYGPVAAAGAVALGGISHFENRPNAVLGGKSREEDRLERAVAARQGVPEDGLIRSVGNRQQEFRLGLAKAFREHPKKTVGLSALMGAMGGVGIAQSAMGIKKLIK